MGRLCETVKVYRITYTMAYINSAGIPPSWGFLPRSEVHFFNPPFCTHFWGLRRTKKYHTNFKLHRYHCFFDLIEYPQIVGFCEIKGDTLELHTVPSPAFFNDIHKKLTGFEGVYDYFQG
jgi:hypothetical protein